MTKRVPAITVLGVPITNAYHRLTHRAVDGHISWAPAHVSYGSNNRFRTLNLLQHRYSEYRAANSVANYYYTSELMTATGLEGVRNGLDSGEPLKEASHNTDAPRLQRTRLEAIEASQADPLVHETFPAAFVREYTGMELKEYESDHVFASDSERQRYLPEL